MMLKTNFHKNSISLLLIVIILPFFASDSLAIEQSKIVIKDYIVDGVNRGTTSVLLAEEGEIEVNANSIGCKTSGNQKSGTAVIAAIPEGQLFIIKSGGQINEYANLVLDNNLLKGSIYENRKLAIEFTVFTREPLLGDGAIFFIQPGIEKMRMGNFYVSTTEAKEWCSVEISCSSEKPKVDGHGIKIWPVNQH
jgi:hypothetical protein